MELIPDLVNDTVVFNFMNSCGANRNICGNCSDFAVAVHNWVLSTEIRYVVIDLQDEKEICPTLLEELIQLSKRMRIPFKFVGVLEKARAILSSYDFPLDKDVFVTPEEAARVLKTQYPHLLQVPAAKLQVGAPIAQSRPRHFVGVETEEGAPEAAPE